MGRRPSTSARRAVRRGLRSDREHRGLERRARLDPSAARILVDQIPVSPAVMVDTPSSTTPRSQAIARMTPMTRHEHRDAEADGPAPPGLGGARPGRQRRAGGRRRPGQVTGREQGPGAARAPRQASSPTGPAGRAGRTRRDGPPPRRRSAGSPRARRCLERALAKPSGLSNAVRSVVGTVSPDAAAAVAIAARWSRIVRAWSRSVGRLVELPGAHRVANGARQLPVTGRRDDLVVACPGGRPRVEQGEVRVARDPGPPQVVERCRGVRLEQVEQAAPIGRGRHRLGLAAPPPTADVAPSAGTGGWYAPTWRDASAQTARRPSSPARSAIARARASEAA